MTDLPPRTCPNCDNRFTPKRNNQDYCSVKCRKGHRRIKHLEDKEILTDRRCIWCGNHIDASVRSHAKFCSTKCRRDAFNQKPCVYCGEPGNSRDHFIPQAFVKRMEDLGWVKKRNVIVPCCSECNSTAGAKVFRTLTEKRKYIHDQYKIKYAKLIDSPYWTKEEVDELGTSLQSHVRRAYYAQELIRARLRWPRVL